MSDWDFQSRKTINDTVVVHGLQMELAAVCGSRDQHLTVFADILTISGVTNSVILPGKNIFLFARELHCTDGAVLDVSGTNITEYERVPAGSLSNGTASSGADGKDGNTGQNGNNGGHVRIFAERIIGPLTINVSGGRGGRGQDGGDGVIGPTPAPAPDKEVPDGNMADVYTSAANAGLRGGTGGAAGRGGRGGRGGDAGSIEIFVIDRHTFQPTYLTTGGSGGDSGNPGKPGLPGNPGLGGNITVYGKE